MTFATRYVERVPLYIGVLTQPLEPRLLFEGTQASSAWPSANLALYLPVRVAKNITVTGLWWTNGSTASGNVCMGLYNEAGDRIAETGIVAQSGASLPQMPSITAFELVRGRYWMGLVLSSTSGTVRGMTASAPRASARWLAAGEEALGSTQIPATMNPSSLAAERRLPFMGLLRA